MFLENYLLHFHIKLLNKYFCYVIVASEALWSRLKFLCDTALIFVIIHPYLNKWRIRNKTRSSQSKKKSTTILNCWMSLSERFNSLKKITCALLSAFGSIYLCEQIFSHMEHSILGPGIY